MVHMDMVTWVCLIVSLAVAYLLGSVNFAIIITRAFSKQDIRHSGSGNAGMTNVLRTQGRLPAVLTLLGDFSKGFLAVLIARVLFTLVAGQGDFLHPAFFVGEYLCAISGMMGHCFPVFYGFKGGKGILVSAGAMLALAPLALVFCLTAFLIGFMLTKIVSVGSLVGAVVYPIAVYAIRAFQDADDPLLQAAMAALIGVMIFIMHRSNIGRLIRGEENRFGKKKG